MRSEAEGGAYSPRRDAGPLGEQGFHEVHVPVHDRYVQGRLTWTRELLAWALPQDPARCPSYLHRILQGDPPVSTRSAFLGEDEMGGGGGERAWWDSQGPPVLPASSYFSGLVAKSCLTLATPCTLAHQAPLSMGFSRQEYWGALLQGIFPTQGWNLRLQSVALAGGFFTTSATWEAHY